MSLDIQDSFDPLTPSDIAALERDLGVVLPEDYRRFLLAHNGGSFADEVAFCGHVAGGELGTIETFYGINAPLHAWDIREVVRRLQLRLKNRNGARLPSELIPIAGTPGGEVCLGVSGAVCGRIFWWDQQEANDIPWENVYEVSDSLHAFLADLVLASDRPANVESDPLFLAVERGDATTIDAFLSGGGSVETRNEEGLPLLVAAALYKRVQLVQTLIRWGAQLEARSKKGQTALYLTDSTDVVGLLLRHGADPNRRERRGRTPLMRAVELNQVLKARLLISFGADLNVRSIDGATPLSLCQTSAREMRRMLVEPRDGEGGASS